ncbi:MAG: ubiquinone/menaquinone biosynthesis methyltransferase [Spirochaetales bacterium]|nr:ubiquinone/menaquinone biosynthesis methyltransferase [Spirochaetales bacterium]
MVSELFDRIARRYDFLNHLFSFGRDFYWRQAASRALGLRGCPWILDCCTGTGDFAFDLRGLYPKARVTGVDFSPQMLALAEKKAQLFLVNIEFQEASVLRLPFEDNSFDAVTMGFALRNVKADLKQVCLEVRRVLKPGAVFAFLDFGPPPSGVLGGVYAFYLGYIMPFMGQLISGDRPAYEYLAQSIKGFYPNSQLIAWFKEWGFSRVKARPMTWGVVNLFTGRK